MNKEDIAFIRRILDGDNSVWDDLSGKYANVKELSPQQREDQVIWWRSIFSSGGDSFFS